MVLIFKHSMLPRNVENKIEYAAQTTTGQMRGIQRLTPLHIRLRLGLGLGFDPVANVYGISSSPRPHAKRNLIMAMLRRPPKNIH